MSPDRPIHAPGPTAQPGTFARPDATGGTTPLHAGVALTGNGPTATPAGADSPAGPTRVPGFTVALPQFEGPFDLLLTLIARRRLDITELALAEVTDEFLAHMRADWDLARASEFLVVASTLLALKAHRLLPRGEEDEDNEDMELLEARDLLFARLLQYRAYKQAAGHMGALAEASARSWPRQARLDPHLAALLPELVLTVGPEELARLAVAAFTRPADPGVQTVHLHEQTVPVTGQITIIVERLRAGGPLTFTELCEDADRTAVVVSRFLALLILHREGQVDLDQTEALGEITVRWSGTGPDAKGIGAPDEGHAAPTDIEEEFG